MALGGSEPLGSHDIKGLSWLGGAPLVVDVVFVGGKLTPMRC